MWNVIWHFQNRLESGDLCNMESVFSVRQGLNYKHHFDIFQAPNCLNRLHCLLSPMSSHFCMFLNNALAVCRIRVGQTWVKYKNAQVSHFYLRRMYIQFMHLRQRWPEERSRYSDSLRVRRSGDRIPVGARFFALVQTGPGARPTFYKTGTGSFPRVKRRGFGIEHPTPSSAEVKETIEVRLYSPSGPSWPALGSTLTFTFTLLMTKKPVTLEHNCINPHSSYSYIDS